MWAFQFCHKGLLNLDIKPTVNARRSHKDLSHLCLNYLPHNNCNKQSFRITCSLSTQGSSFTLLSTPYNAGNFFSLFTGQMSCQIFLLVRHFTKWTRHNNMLTDNSLKKITQNVLVRCSVILSNLNVKLARHFQNLVGQCSVTYCYFQYCNTSVSLETNLNSYLSFQQTAQISKLKGTQMKRKNPQKLNQ